MFFNIEFIPYPHYIVFDIEIILEVLNQCQTSDLTYIAKQIPVSDDICDSLMKKPAFIVHEDPQELLKQFVMELERRQELIVKEVTELYPYPDDFEMLPDKVQKVWKRWLNQVPVIGFNSGRYNLNLIKIYFVQEISKAEVKEGKLFVAKKENEYMFLTTEKFKFLDIKNFSATGMSYDQWCKSLWRKLEKLVFPYKWLTSYKKLRSHGPVIRRGFYSSFKKKKLSRQECKKFREEFYKCGCVTMYDWLKEYNIAVDKTRRQDFPYKLDILRDAVVILGVSQSYVLNKALRQREN